VLTLTKHHALGNDFLVLLGVEVEHPDRLAIELCDRRRGIGADGLLIGGSAPGVDATMRLFNADGSRAEMSGNGIRCFAQALALQHGSLGPLHILTDAGERVVEFVDGEPTATVHCTVDMGEISELPEPADWAALQCDPLRPVAHLGVGNPHSVVGVEDVAVVDLGRLGALVPHVNLEIVEPGPEPDAITMRVHERGAGITEACGTGACASAWAALSWGLVPAATNEIVVHMDGGDARVRVHQPRRGLVTLVGPSTFVATVSVEGEVLDTAGATVTGGEVRVNE
jgi:diaminopimelate epimerase